MTPNTACQAIIDKETADCILVRANAKTLQDQLPTLVPLFQSLETQRYCYYYPADARVICAVKTREDLAKVRAIYAGVWTKNDVAGTYVGDDDNVEYQAYVNGIDISIRVTALPPSCTIVEEIKEVPATTRKIRRLVCNEPAKEHAERGKILSVEETPTEVELVNNISL